MYIDKNEFKNHLFHDLVVVSKSFSEISVIIQVKDVIFFQCTLHANCIIVTLGNDTVQYDQ